MTITNITERERELSARVASDAITMMRLAGIVIKDNTVSGLQLFCSPRVKMHNTPHFRKLWQNLR